MTSSMKKEVSSPESDGEGNTRKRVCKACDRCRLKKSKCDGSSPCNRCQSDNAICVFGERKKSHDKVYPKGYVEMLEQHHDKMVNAMREMHQLLETNEKWPGSPLRRTSKGFILTHDILERLGCLKLGPEDQEDYFEENTDMLLDKMTLKQEQEENPYPTPTTIQTEFSPVGCDIMERFPSQLFGSGTTTPIDPYQLTPPSISPTAHVYCMDTSKTIDAAPQLNSAATNYPWHQTQSFSPDAINPYAYGAAPSYTYGLMCDRGNPCLPTYNDDPRYTPYGDVMS